MLLTLSKPSNYLQLYLKGNSVWFNLCMEYILYLTDFIISCVQHLNEWRNQFWSRILQDKKSFLHSFLENLRNNGFYVFAFVSVSDCAHSKWWLFLVKQVVVWVAYHSSGSAHCMKHIYSLGKNMVKTVLEHLCSWSFTVCLWWSSKTWQSYYHEMCQIC